MVGLVSAPYSPFGCAVLYPSMRFPNSFLSGPLRLFFVSFGTCWPGLLKLLKIALLEPWSANRDFGVLDIPPVASLPRARVLRFYIRQADHGIRSSNYATVIAGQGNQIPTPAQEQYLSRTWSIRSSALTLG